VFSWIQNQSQNLLQQTTTQQKKIVGAPKSEAPGG
jgi:hypothetical protein